jgi:hypothetical protein
METTYDVRVYKTEVYRGARVSSYRVRWKTAGQDRRRTFRNKAQADVFRGELLCPVALDEDVGVIDGEDVTAGEGPAGGCRAGPWCACWRGGGQSDVISVTAILALASSTIALRSA